MMSSHIDALVDDYVLDLLSEEKRRSVELHASLCPRCMHLLTVERARMARVQSALRSGSGSSLQPRLAWEAGMAHAVHKEAGRRRSAARSTMRRTAGFNTGT